MNGSDVTLIVFFVLLIVASVYLIVFKRKLDEGYDQLLKGRVQYNLLKFTPLSFIARKVPVFGGFVSTEHFVAKTITKKRLKDGATMLETSEIEFEKRESLFYLHRLIIIIFFSVYLLVIGILWIFFNTFQPSFLNF